MVNCRKTALAAEVEYKDHKSDTIYASFKVKKSKIEKLKIVKL